MEINEMDSYVKQQIQECYNEMYDYVFDFEMPEDGEDENFTYLKNEIEKRQISIPKDLYEKINSFIDKEFLPLANGEAFEGMVSAIENDSEESEIGAQYLWAIIQRRNALKEFGMKELYPLLVENS